MSSTEPIRTTVITVPSMVYGSGLVGLFGWISICILLIFATVVLLCWVSNRKTKLPGMFFACAHLQVLFFVFCNGVFGVQHVFSVSCSCCGSSWFMLALGHTLFALVAGVGLSIAAILAVSAITRIRPALPFWSWVGLGILAVDIGMLVGGTMMIFSRVK